MHRILKVKQEIGTLSKNSSNPFFKSKYLDLSDLITEVEPLLHKYGLVLVQPINNGIVETQIVDAENGDIILNSGLVLPDLKDPQKLGSCITYYRRYTLKSLLAIAEADDDGNLASKPETVKKKRPSLKQLDQAKVKYQNDKTVLDKMIETFIVEKAEIEYIKDGDS